MGIRRGYGNLQSDRPDNPACSWRRRGFTEVSGAGRTPALPLASLRDANQTQEQFVHSVLFVATMNPQHADWSTFLNGAHDKLRTAEGVVRLAENVWLLDLTISATSFGSLIYQADLCRVEYGILPFVEAPQWLPASYSPKPIQGRNARQG